MNIKNFDLNISEHIEKLISHANKRFPKRTWHIEITLWQDKDFLIELRSTWGYYQDRFFYKKSDGDYKYYRKVIENKIEGLE